MATKLINIENLQRTAAEYDKQLHELPGLMLEPFAERMHLTLLEADREQRRVNVRRKGGLLKPYTGAVTQLEELEALRVEESILRPRLGYIALVDNVWNYQEKMLTMRGGRLVEDSQHPYEYEVLRSVVQTFIEDVTLSLPHAKFGSGAGPLGVFDGYNTIIDSLITEGKISKKASNLVECDKIEAPAGPEDTKALDAFVGWLRKLSPALRAKEVDVIIPQEILQHVMDAFERRRHFTGETTVEALEAYLRVKASIGGTLSLLTGPEVGTGDRLIALRRGNITVSVCPSEGSQLVQVRSMGIDPNLVGFWIQALIGTRIDDWHSKVFATSGGTIAQAAGLSGDYIPE